MENQVFVMNHPLIQHKLTHLRNKTTGSKEFRELVSEIAMLECYEATRDLPLEDTQIETPMGMATTQVIAGRKLAFVPILRAGLGMVDGVLALVPAAKVGHIGLYRDHETLQPVEYYSKLPSGISRSAMSLYWIRCWRPAAQPLMLFPLSSAAAPRALSLCALLRRRRESRPLQRCTLMCMFIARR